MSERHYPHAFSVQIGFWDNNIYIPAQEIANIKSGDQASTVISNIFDSYSVSKFSYRSFNPESTYPIEADLPISWSPWKGEDQLMILSQQIYNDTLSDVFKFEGVEYAPCEILGVCSKVKLHDGAIRQIRMLDFDMNTNLIKIQNIGLSNGIYLKTDRSYHYYGREILSEEDWKKWIHNLINIKGSEEIFGPDYLSMCLKRDYTALRISGYKGTSKEKTPVVISKM